MSSVCSPECNATLSVTEPEGNDESAVTFILDWEDGRSLKVERQPDGADYKMFLVTALA